MDGFDYYNTNAIGASKWNTFSAGAFGTGRFGGQSMVMNSGNSAVKNISATQTLICAFALRVSTAFAATTVLQFIDSTTVQVDLRFNSSGNLIVTRNGTTLATGSTAMVIDTWHHIQIKVKIDNTTGTYEVKLDGVAEISGTGADTQDTGNASADSVKFTSTNSQVSIDDVVIMDTTGSQNNNLPGECKITTVRPDGNGNVNNFTPSAGSNYQCVDETIENGDTDYVYSSTANDIDLYTIGNTTLSGTVMAVQNNLVARKDDAGTRQIASVCRRSSTNYVGATKTLTSSYTNESELYELDPSTSAAWTQSGLDAMEMGAQVIT